MTIDNKFVQIIIFIFIMTLIVNVLIHYYKKTKRQEQSDTNQPNSENNADNGNAVYPIISKTILWTILLIVVGLIFGYLALAGFFAGHMPNRE